ncbi:MAG: DNA polymerase I [Ruminococcus sp.]|nr:DNA polymerase I [Ruminococcus sp.]
MKLLAIDGNSILNRAFYGIKALSNKQGVPTNAVFGFTNIYLSAISAVQPDCAAIAFDLRSPTFRHKAVASYKANRKGMPDDLAVQLPIVKQLFAAMGVKIIECEGYEADDVLGTLARICSEHGDECVILTGDRDSLQLIDERVSVRLATNREPILYDRVRFEEEYGFAPIQLIDLKALMGDSSDNISGVAGIGQKTAAALIQQWGTIENLYEHLDEAELTKGVLTKLRNGEADAQQSKWLATIVRDAPIPQAISEYQFGEMNDAAVSELLTELEMFKLLEKLKLRPSAVAKTEVVSAVPAELPELQCESLTAETIAQMRERVTFLLEDTALSVIAGGTLYQTSDETLILAFLQSDVQKQSFAAKSAYHFALSHGGVLLHLCFDAELAAYLLDPTMPKYEISTLCGVYGVPYDETRGAVCSLPILSSVLRDKLERDGMTALLQEIELPLMRVLAEMEHDGVRLDIDGVKRFGAALTDDIAALQEQIYFMAGHPFNIASPKQLGVVLFEELGLPAKKKTKTGYSTNADVMEELRGKHPIIDLILKYRQLTKLSSTYVEGLLKTVAPDGRIHTCFRQTETRTGRISSVEPNLQNIPVRTERGREMRRFFLAAEDKVLLDADYSQIELRILAHLCGDEAMQEAFRTGQDIHAMTAAQVFGLPAELISPEMRSAAKAVNFGIIYGIGAFSLSKDIGVSVAEAKRYISDYLRNYPNVERFMDGVVEQAADTGYVTTLFGRRRPVPELQSRNKILQAAGRRIAMNTPIQGTAADVIKIAMVRVSRRLAEEQLDARLILQVHDELIVESTREDAPRAALILQEEMEHACEMSVPLTAEVHEGDSWFDAKG